MAGSVNKVVLIGNLGRDPEIRTIQSGDKVCNFSIATSEDWKDKQTGEKKSRTEWHRIVIWNQGIVNVCEKYLKKGAKVYIEGQLETRKYTDKDGAERYTTEVVLRVFGGTMTMLDPKNKTSRDDAPPDEDDYEDRYGSAGTTQQQPNARQAGTAPPDEYEEEIPF